VLAAASETPRRAVDSGRARASRNGGNDVAANSAAALKKWEFTRIADRESNSAWIDKRDGRRKHLPEVDDS